MGVCLVEIAKEDQEFLQSAALPHRAQLKEHRQVSHMTH
jgi:hypothetical protein